MTGGVESSASVREKRKARKVVDGPRKFIFYQLIPSY